MFEEKKFTKSKTVEEAIIKYQEENHPIISFVNNENIELKWSVVGYIYLQYKVYCVENGFQSVSNVNFSKQIRHLYHLDIRVQWMNGKNKRLFIKS